jgi:hypothetical protein
MNSLDVIDRDSSEPSSDATTKLDHEEKISIKRTGKTDLMVLISYCGLMRPF